MQMKEALNFVQRDSTKECDTMSYKTYEIQLCQKLIHLLLREMNQHKLPQLIKPSMTYQPQPACVVCSS